MTIDYRTLPIGTIAEAAATIVEAHDATGAGACWYTQALEAAHKASDGRASDDHQAAGVVAALSPRCRWNENLRRAAVVWAGENPGGLSLHVGRAVAIRDGAPWPAVLRGDKTLNFAPALAGDHTAVTIDAHMAAAYAALADLAGPIAAGVVAPPVGDTWRRLVARFRRRPQIKRLENVGAYAACVRITERMADLVGLSPRDAQAALWVTVAGGAP